VLPGERSDHSAVACEVPLLRDICVSSELIVAPVLARETLRALKNRRDLSRQRMCAHQQEAMFRSCEARG
jgi:hypothetical protein